MSYTKSVEIMCDRCGGTLWYALEPSVAEARKDARSEGWSARGGEDFCSDECRAKRGDHHG